MIQWLGLHALTAKGLGLIPGWGTKIPQAACYSQKIKEREREKQRREPLRLTSVSASGAQWITCKLAKAGPQRQEGRWWLLLVHSRQLAGWQRRHWNKCESWQEREDWFLKRHQVCLLGVPVGFFFLTARKKLARSTLKKRVTDFFLGFHTLKYARGQNEDTASKGAWNSLIPQLAYLFTSHALWRRAVSPASISCRQLVLST